MKKRIVTFGEIMMRLNPEGYLRFLHADKFEASYAGGEANVAVSLANYGMDAAFVSKVPAHEIGQNSVNALRHFGVDTQHILPFGTPEEVRKQVRERIAGLDVIVQLVWHRLNGNRRYAEIGKFFHKGVPMRSVGIIKFSVLGETDDGVSDP